MTMRMLSLVTPPVVAPPLSAPAGHGTAHGAARVKDTFMRFRMASQSGDASA